VPKPVRRWFWSRKDEEEEVAPQNIMTDEEFSMLLQMYTPAMTTLTSSQPAGGPAAAGPEWAAAADFGRQGMTLTRGRTAMGGMRPTRCDTRSGPGAYLRHGDGGARGGGSPVLMAVTSGRVSSRQPPAAAGAASSAGAAVAPPGEVRMAPAPLLQIKSGVQSVYNVQAAAQGSGAPAQRLTDENKAAALKVGGRRCRP
jgi:hypothetical protein